MSPGIDSNPFREAVNSEIFFRYVFPEVWVVVSLWPTNPNPKNTIHLEEKDSILRTILNQVDGEDLDILFGLVRYVPGLGMYHPGLPGTTQNVVNVEQEILSYLQRQNHSTKDEKE